MNIQVNRDEISAVASGKVPDRMRSEAARLASELEQVVVLGDLFPVGLADGADGKTAERFARWERGSSLVHASEAAAREANPGAFRPVETRWGRAGNIHRVYSLADGRQVIKHGVWWEVPEPGGDVCVFYFA